MAMIPVPSRIVKWNFNAAQIPSGIVKWEKKLDQS